MSYADRHRALWAEAKQSKPTVPATSNVHPAVLASQPASEAAAAPEALPNNLAVHTAALEADLVRLKGLPLPKKLELKRGELLPRYMKLMKALPESELPDAGMIVFYVMLWSIDTEDFTTAADMLAICIDQQFESYGDFTRTPVQVYVGQLADYFLKAQAAGTFDYSRSQLIELMNLSEEHADDLLEPIRADVFKALGQDAEQGELFERAISYYESALAVYPAAKVKRPLNRLLKEREARESAAEQPSQAEPSPPTAAADEA